MVPRFYTYLAREAPARGHITCESRNISASKKNAKTDEIVFGKARPETRKIQLKKRVRPIENREYWGTKLSKKGGAL